MSNLPSIGTTIGKQDTNKQLSQMRSYMDQLRDELEAELMNIGYDNLSGDLRKRLDKNSEDILINKSDYDDFQGFVNANMVSVAYLEANYITADVIAATYVTTEHLLANYITAEDIAATYITASVVEATYVKTTYLTSNYITANKIASDYVATKNFTASNIAGFFKDPANGLTITTENLRAQKFYYYTSLDGSGADYHQLSLKTFTVNGTQYRCLGV